VTADKGCAAVSEIRREGRGDTPLCPSSFHLTRSKHTKESEQMADQDPTKGSDSEKLVQELTAKLEQVRRRLPRTPSNATLTMLMV
jgi:hypothetical protein